ncbi:hypothetical protein D3C73_1479450 [compost metagenome]
MTEVVEHMSQEEAGQLIRQICTQVDFDKFIITTPNADFNRYYELSGFRHDDHKWEMGEEMFQRWMRDVIKETDLQAEFVAVGDGVNDIKTTQGVILTKRRG